MSIRSDLAGLIRPHLPRTFKLVHDEGTVDTRGKIVVRLSQQSFRPLPEAPIGNILVDFTARVFVEGENLARMEDDLDAGVGDFLAAIDKLPGGTVAWTGADKFGDTDSGALGYDIGLTITAKS